MWNDSAVMVSSRVSARPWNIDLTPFYLASPPPPKKNILNLSDPPSPFPHPLYEQPPQNFRELDSPLEIYPRPKKQRLIF